MSYSEILLYQTYSKHNRSTKWRERSIWLSMRTRYQGTLKVYIWKQHKHQSEGRRKHWNALFFYSNNISYIIRTQHYRIINDPCSLRTTSSPRIGSISSHLNVPNVAKRCHYLDEIEYSTITHSLCALHNVTIDHEKH